ncbi:MAG: Hsp20 family protein [Burkholderiales bacterium]|nr:Hsp20 family protein [Burkholderiales bacterium]
MANTARFDPFNELEYFFKGLWAHPMRFQSELMAQMSIKVDVTKIDDTYIVKAGMSGVKKEDISVSVGGNQAIISSAAKKEAAEGKKGGQVIRSERHRGRVSRSFILPHEIGEAKSSANDVDGVLLVCESKIRGQE